MRIGALRTRVTLKSDAITPVTSGDNDDFTTGYTTVATVWAQVEPVGEMRVLASKQIGETVTHRVTIRARSDTLIAWQYLEFGGWRYRVRSFAEADDRNRFQVLQCERLEVVT